MPKTPYKKAKDNAWKAFSKYIRTRDCIATTDTLDEGICVTCGQRFDIKRAHAGHAIDSRCMSLLFDEQLVNFQCLTRESKILMGDGSFKNIDEIVIGDNLSAFNEHTFEGEKAVVTSCNSFMPHRLYEVEMENGDKFYATEDHMVVANGKFTKIEDMLHTMSAYNIMEYEKNV